ncbi:MAG: phytanoyl-CoA dioxygenase family protein [Jatrophihabitantaceae bacterium]
MIEQTGVTSRLPARLSSNGIEISGDEFAPMRDSTRWRGQPRLLRDRFREHGYLLLRQVLDRRRVLELRADYFGRFDPAMLAAGSAAMAGIFSGTLPAGLPEYGTAGHPAYDLVRTARFDAFTRDPELRRIAEILLDAPVELIPRRILRHFHRNSGKASRAHVDYDYLTGGGDQLLTAWIPLGDCPIECGGLVYLEGSHRVSREELDTLRPFTDRPSDQRPVSNDLGLTARTLGGRWLWADYRAGDVVLHGPHLVHASLDNTSDVMRLSADLRFRASDSTPDERWAGDWSADDGF